MADWLFILSQEKTASCRLLYSFFSLIVQMGIKALLNIHDRRFSFLGLFSLLSKHTKFWAQRFWGVHCMVLYEYREE
jgi:hypothetical protein